MGYTVKTGHIYVGSKGVDTKYTVTLTVTDDDGGKGSDTLTVKVFLPK
ncbi:hypothetical protein H8E77_19795 [bacterium]|nr:hypothetical protein [bacterium]